MTSLQEQEILSRLTIEAYEEAVLFIEVIRNARHDRKEKLKKVKMGQSEAYKGAEDRLEKDINLLTKMLSDKMESLKEAIKEAK